MAKNIVESPSWTHKNVVFSSPRVIHLALGHYLNSLFPTLLLCQLSDMQCWGQFSLIVTQLLPPPVAIEWHAVLSWLKRSGHSVLIVALVYLGLYLYHPHFLVEPIHHHTIDPCIPNIFDYCWLSFNIHPSINKSKWAFKLINGGANAHQDSFEPPWYSVVY